MRMTGLHIIIIIFSLTDCKIKVAMSTKRKGATRQAITRGNCVSMWWICRHWQRLNISGTGLKLGVSVKESNMSSSSFVSPLLNDRYQLSMCYSYWKQGQHNEPSVFELFHRKCPFGGHHTVFAGLSQVLDHINNFKFTEEDVAYIRECYPNAEDGFFDYLASMDCRDVTINSVDEGCLVFPRVPMIQVCGPIAIVQLLETTLLNLVNFASLIATNASRMKLAAGKNKTLLEFGTRRAQGPNGAVSAALYSYIGGCDSTSNMLAGKLYDIPTVGTHAHSFVCSFSDIIPEVELDGKDLTELCLSKRVELGFENTNNGELAAFIAFAASFPDGFVALVDTYDTLSSGVPNFLTVASVLHDLGHQAKGIRLDSGDLAALSVKARKMFSQSGDWTKDFKIVASDGINEKKLISFKERGHEIDIFGIGTHLATCQAQPALGGVYKLMKFKGTDRIKLSENVKKVTIPGEKVVYRLYIKQDDQVIPITDFLCASEETAPVLGVPVLCWDPFEEQNRIYVTPQKVEVLLRSRFRDGKLTEKHPSVAQVRTRCLDAVARQDTNSPYKVTVSKTLRDHLHNMWIEASDVTVKRL